MARYEQFDDEFDGDEEREERDYTPKVRYRNEYEKMAAQRPSALHSLIQSGTIDDNALGQALQALGSLPGDGVTALLMEHLRHPDLNVRASAVEGLAKKLEKGNINPQLQEILKLKLTGLEIGTPVPVEVVADRRPERPARKSKAA